MTLTLQEGINTLLSGNILTWDGHDGYQEGGIFLGEPGERRLFEYLLSQPIEQVKTGNDQLFDGIIASWENDEYDPKDNQSGNNAFSIVDGFRLAYIETEGFGGLNLFDGPVFKLDINRQSWCLEGQNGSGKTSLISAIAWALTGQRIREHVGPIKDDGKREPVYDSKGKLIGTWPPLVSYPLDRADLIKDAKVRVKLIFIDNSGNEAIAERSVVCKANEDIGQVEKNIDNRLLISPQLIETGILMPSRLAHINFGQKSQTLYEAVKSLTGLDQLGVIGDGAAVITHGGRKFLKYAKDQGIARIESSFSKHVARANEHAKEIELDLALVQDISSKDLQDELKKIIGAVSTQASEYTEALESEVSEDIDLSDAKDRQKVIEAVGEAKSVAKKAASEVQVFTVLKALFDTKVDKQLDAIPSFLSASLKKLDAAIEWATRQKEDEKLRLKALASKWYEAPESLTGFSLCPLCISELSSPEQKKLAEELKLLKVAGEEAERRLEDVCLSLREGLIKSFPENLQDKLNFLGKMEPKSEIVSAAIKIFTAQPPFSDILTGTSKVMSTSIAQKSEDLSVFESALQSPDVTDEPDCVTQVREVIFQIQRSLELAKWWNDHRDEFSLFWKDVIGLVPDGEEPAQDTLKGKISKIEEALVAAQPYDLVAKELVDIQQLAFDWQGITNEQERRKAIAKALAPLKDLRVLVDAETARSIATLSDRIKDILDRIHTKERLGFHDAGLKKKEVHVHGSFTDEMKIDALPIANTSWLRSILWAFTYALREQTVASLNANPFPLTLLDDPQTTYDPRNKRRWAKELAKLAGLKESDHHNAQVFMVTHERQFFMLITEIENMDCEKGIIAPADRIAGCATIINGNVLERIYGQAKDENDDAKAREFIRQTRIHVEKLLKYMLRGEGQHIADSNLEKLRKDLTGLINKHVAPFTRPVFEKLLNDLSGGGREVKLINTPPHDDDETTGLAEANDVMEFWEKTLRRRIHTAFSTYSAFENHYGDPRVFDYPDNVVTLPVGNNDSVKSAALFHTGIAAAAKTDGLVGDGELSIEEWEAAEAVILHNHDIYQLTANTLEPVASVGNFVIISNYAPVTPKCLVATAVGERLLARRFNSSEIHPDLAILTAQSVDPHNIAEPQLVPFQGLKQRKIVGTLFPVKTKIVDTQDELVIVADQSEYLSLLDQARLFNVKGRSAEPVALDGQSLIVGQPLNDASRWSEQDGRLVIAFDADGASYFKRFRLAHSGIFVLESLNPDGTASAELLSLDGRDGIPQLTHLLPVFGVLFELPGS